MTAKTYQSQIDVMQAISTGLDVMPTTAWAIIENAMIFGNQAFPHSNGHSNLIFSSGVFTLIDNAESE